MNIAITPVSLRFRNVKYFGPQPVTMNLSKPDLIMIADPAIYGFSAVTEILSVYLKRKKIRSSHFDKPEQPLPIALAVRIGDSVYQIERIFTVIDNDIDEQVFVYEWNAGSECYLPMDNAESFLINGLPLADHIRRAFVIWERGLYHEINQDDTIREEICLPLLTERIRFIRTELQKMAGNTETADIKTVTQTSDQGNIASADKDETTDPQHQIIDWVIRYVAYRIKRFIQDQNAVSGKASCEIPKEKVLQELIQLFRDALAVEEKRRQFDDLNAGIAQLERVITKTEDELKTELHTVTILINEKRPWALKVSEYEKELELHHRELVRMQKTQEKQKHILEQGLQDKIRMEFLERWIAEYKIYVDEKRKEIEQIQLSVCPACEKAIGGDQQALLKKNIQQIIDAYNEKIFRYQIDLDEIRHAMNKLRETYADLEKEIRQQPVVWHQYYVTEHRLQIARQHEKEYQALKEQSERLKMTLQNRSFARREQQAIDELRKQVQANGYQPSLHRSVYRKISDRFDPTPDGALRQYDIPDSKAEQTTAHEAGSEFKNQFAAFGEFFPAGISADDLLQSQDPAQLISRAVRVITALKPSVSERNAAGDSLQRTKFAQRSLITREPAIAEIRRTILEALGLFADELAAISDLPSETARDHLQKVAATFHYSVACSLLNRMTGEAYGKWVYGEDSGGFFILSVKRGEELILPENLPGDIQSCALLCLRIAGSLTGIGEAGDSGTVLFAEVPFLLHESEFIYKLRTLINELMTWMNRIIIIIPFSSDPSGDGLDYQLTYGSGGITVTKPGFPAA